MERDEVQEWVDGYRRAWESNSPQDIGSLFSPDALYFTDPFAEPWRGRDEIVRRWLADKDEPGDSTFRFEIVAVDGDLGVVQAVTTYLDPPREYANLWLVHLAPDGRALSFIEYWMERPR